MSNSRGSLYWLLMSLALATSCHSSSIFKSTQYETLFTGGELTEGPAVDSVGFLYFSDQPNDVIRRISPSGELSIFVRPSGVANGLAFDTQGRLLVAQSNHGNYAGDTTAGKRRVVRYAPDDSLAVLAAEYAHQPLLGPNDLCVDQGGRIYFTDPYYPESGTAKTQSASGVYRIDAPGDIVRVIADLQKPNGILITPNGQTMYISDRGTQRLHRYRVQADGGLVADEIVYQFTGRGIDGMAMDTEGRIYGAAGEGDATGVYVIDPKRGKLLDFVAFPATAYNVCFGGADGKSLYVCAGGSVHRLRTKAKGIILPHEVDE